MAPKWCSRGRRRAPLEALARAITEDGGTAAVRAADVTVEDDVRSLMHFCLTTFGRLDVAFNNAGTVSPSGRTDQLELTTWRAELDADHGRLYRGEARGPRPHQIQSLGADRSAGTSQCTHHRQRRHPALPKTVGRKPPRTPAAGTQPVWAQATVEEIASFVAYLLSDEAAFVTGAALTADGGFTAS
jgi:NAD(P)-dependent dehydrogenase (short-subunit alcohol dehydrogenase family)